MNEVKDNKSIDAYKALRYNILAMLYKAFRDFPQAQIELGEIETACETSTKDLNWNLVYLEKCGYIELAKSSDCYPYAACSATMTAAGIDLVEDPEAFEKRFQPVS